jgi:small subunit ribosomal protein S2
MKQPRRIPPALRVSGQSERIQMSLPSLKDLLEAGAHFGHQTRRWNPKMDRYIYGARNGVHIIDLTKTAPALEAACKFAEDVAKRGGKILFVGTKRQAKAVIRQEATRVGQPYVSERWLGGMLTNFRTIRAQVNRLKKLEGQLESGELAANYNKKELLGLTQEINKLNFIFGGIKDMEQLPAALFVTDAPREAIALAEAAKLGIPVIAIADSNADPDMIDYPIPANDDAIKSITVIATAIADAAKAGESSRPKEETEAVELKPKKSAKSEK